MNEPIKSFRDLIVWQRAVQLSSTIYALTEKFPPEERFSLSDQMRRASVSIVSNIAEGRHRGGRNDFLRFLYIAYASTTELEAQLYLSEQLPWAKSCDFTNCKTLLSETAKMLNTMIKNLKEKVPGRS